VRDAHVDNGTLPIAHARSGLDLIANWGLDFQLSVPASQFSVS